MKIKRLVPLTLVTLMLAGCSGNTGTGGGGVAWKDTGRLIFDDNNEVVFEDVDIVFRTICDGLDKTCIQNLVNKFNTLNTGIHVDFDSMPQGSMYTTLSRMISSDLSTVPELTMFHNERISSLQRTKLFQPIDRIYEKMNVTLDLDNYYENTLSNNYVDGSLYGLPIDAHTEAILYRNDLLEKYHLSVPTSYDELVNAASIIQNGEKQTNSKFYGIAMSYDSFGTYQYVFNTAIFQNGGNIVGSDGMPDWDKNNSLKTAINKLRDLFYSPNPVAKKDLSGTDTDKDFAEGNCAFSFVYTWNISNILTTRYGDSKMESDDWGILSMENLFASDLTKDYANSQYAISHSFFMPRTIKDITKKAAACYFAKWFNEQSLAAWSESGHVPQYKPTIQSSDYQERKITKKITSHYGSPENFRNFPSTPFYSEVADSLALICTSALVNETVNVDNLISTNLENARLKIYSSLD